MIVWLVQILPMASLLIAGQVPSQSLVVCDNSKGCVIYRMPKTMPGRLFDVKMVVDHPHSHLFWISVNDEDDTDLRHLRIDTTGGHIEAIGEPMILGSIYNAPRDDAYRPVLQDGKLCTAWCSSEGLIVRQWDREQGQWAAPQILTTSRTAERPVVFPGKGIAFWVESAHADLAPLYVQATQPDNRTERQRTAEFMAKLHASEYSVMTAKLQPGDKRAWSAPHDVLGASGLDINDRYLAVFMNQDGSFSVFATSRVKSPPSEGLHQFVYRPETGTSVGGTWQSARDVACFSVFSLGDSSRYCVLWMDIPDAATGTTRLFCSFSDAPDRALCLSGDGPEFVIGYAPPAFCSASGNDRGLVVWNTLTDPMKRSTLASRFSGGQWTVPVPVSIALRPNGTVFTGKDHGLFWFREERAIRLAPFKVDFGAESSSVPATKRVTPRSRPVVEKASKRGRG